MKNLYIPLIIMSALTFNACKKEKIEFTPPELASGNIELEFEHKVGSSSLTLNSANYTNDNGDSYTVSKFAYYVSNIKLTRADGQNVNIPAEYYLIDAANSSTHKIVVNNIPPGEYTELSFLLGVDSTRNVSGAQTGALDPANGMFWSWNTGYIFLKMEGTSPQSTATGNQLRFHIGGFREANNTNALRTIKPSFNGQKLIVKEKETSGLHFDVDVNKMFKSPNLINFANINTVHMPGMNALKIADNYQYMFTITDIHNH